MKITTFTTLYPNILQPRLGVFVKNRMMHVAQIKDVKYNVIAPVANAPILKYFKGSKFAIGRSIPVAEDQQGIKVAHPKYLTIPKLTNNVKSLVRAGLKEIGADIPDVIDGQYLYPDGVASYHIAKKLNRPLILTARGSDVNFWMGEYGPKAEILAAIDYADKVICVSDALVQELMSYGVASDKLKLLYNGINHDIFNPKNRTSKLSYYLMVGNLVALKGQEFAIRALEELPKERLIIIGSGEDASKLRTLTAQLGLGAQVEFISYADQKELSSYYAGAKATILMSSMEGMPNVALESLASGCPVIATNVGGLPEIISDQNGILLKERSSEALKEALTAFAAMNFDVLNVAATVSHMDWNKTAKAQYEIYEKAIENFTLSL